MVTAPNLSGCTLLHSGKVRDVYQYQDDKLLIVATDRISAFDYILSPLVKDKGKILHKISMFWFDFVQNIIPTHIITGNFDDFPKELKQYEYLRDRAMIVKKAKRLDVECIVRGYLAGSGWKEYQKSQTVCGVKLPQGLQQSQQLQAKVCRILAYSLKSPYLCIVEKNQTT